MSVTRCKPTTISKFRKANRQIEVGIRPTYAARTDALTDVAASRDIDDKFVQNSRAIYQKVVFLPSISRRSWVRHAHDDMERFQLCTRSATFTCTRTFTFQGYTRLAVGKCQKYIRVGEKRTPLALSWQHFKLALFKDTRIWVKRVYIWFLAGRTQGCTR